MRPEEPINKPRASPLEVSLDDAKGAHMSITTRMPKRAKKRKNHRYGDLVRVAALLSGRAPKTIYAVLEGNATSAWVSDAIQKARKQIAGAKRAAA